jgi:esterase/lipase superfamily enzyme
LPQPFVIFISRVDRALTLSGLITGRKPRLGVIADAQEVTRPDVKVIDLTELADGAALNHFIAVTSPAAIELLTDSMARSERSGRSLLRSLADRLPGGPPVPR